MALFFTADHHFGHGGARGLFRRPFESTVAMDEAMIARWNAVVGAGDTVWHLGDFAVLQPPARMAQILDRLAGTKHLVAGNNDPAATRTLAGWASVHDLLEIEAEGRRLVLCHYPLRSWNGMGKGALQLHGHSHGRLKPMSRQVDVGVDCWGFAPVPLARLLPAKKRPLRNDRPATA
ncbi:MAG: metallophosphoesterase family protein [Geminicoccaceae bacterium]